MVRALTIYAVLAFVLPASCQASRIARPPVPEGMQIVYAECPADPDAAGCLWDNKLYVWKRSDQQTLNHETGHYVDTHYLTDAERNEFMQLAQIRDEPWFAVTDEGQRFNRATGTEQFADAYAHCRMGDDPAGRRLKGGGVRFSWWQSTPFRPTPKRYRTICRFIVRAMVTIDGPVTSG